MELLLVAAVALGPPAGLLARAGSTGAPHATASTATNGSAKRARAGAHRSLQRGRGRTRVEARDDPHFITSFTIFHEWTQKTKKSNELEV
jgi:hypothetical protein